MLRINLIIIFISYLVIIVFYGCSANNVTGPVNFDRDTPVWLKEKIGIMSGNSKYYFATKVYRYDYQQRYIYHIYIPVSSCVFCELYDQQGKRIQPDSEELRDFLIQDTNKILVWEWKK